MNRPSNDNSACSILVGAEAVDVTPRGPMFLYGYPHAPRISTGVNDPLLASAMYLSDRRVRVLFVSVDVIWLSKAMVANARAQIAEQTGLAGEHIMITATHTHSGPVTVEMLSNSNDHTVPPPDSCYLAVLVQGIVRSAVAAVRNAEPAEVAFAVAECPSIGGNRHDPRGPTVNAIPLIWARSLTDKSRSLAMMYVNRVHPTVLHEDSTLISGDFPGLCRIHLQDRFLSRDCPVLCHLGAAGNQSPRYIARSHTLAEADRLGAALAHAIELAASNVEFASDFAIDCISSMVQLPARAMPTIPGAEVRLISARNRLAELQDAEGDPGAVRTAQCAVFGAEETLGLARSEGTGELANVVATCLPAEIQVIRIGNWSLVGWPGEVFVEFAVQLRQKFPDAFVITLANGELQGYLVTAAGVESQCYESANAIFASPEGGNCLLNETVKLLTSASPPADLMQGVRS